MLFENFETYSYKLNDVDETLAYGIDSIYSTATTDEMGTGSGFLWLLP